MFMSLDSPRPKLKGMLKYGKPYLEHPNYTVGFISVSQYCKQRFITRNILRTFVNKGWVLLIKSKNTRYSCKEICTEEINDYLGI